MAFAPPPLAAVSAELITSLNCTQLFLQGYAVPPELPAHGCTEAQLSAVRYGLAATAPQLCKQLATELKVRGHPCCPPTASNVSAGPIASQPPLPPLVFVLMSLPLPLPHAAAAMTSELQAQHSAACCSMASTATLTHS